MSLHQALDRQRSIYLKGMSGARPPIPFHSVALREAARRQMSERAWAYIDGGAGNEETISANGSAFSRHAIRPRMMRPNESADHSGSLFGRPLAFPLLLAPIGALDLVCRGRTEWLRGPPVSWACR